MDTRRAWRGAGTGGGSVSEAFVMDAIGLDGIKISQDGEEGYIVTCVEYSENEVIDTETVHDKAREYNLDVEWAKADFANGEVRVRVSDGGSE